MSPPALDYSSAPDPFDTSPTGAAGGQRYGADLIVDLLQQYGLPYVALNPGASFRGLHDSLVNYGGNRPEMILCQHEKIAVGIAHGYAKATGRPMATILHDVVGLLHATLGIYYAFIDRVPMMVLGATGPVSEAKRRPKIDWIHTANVQGNAVRDFVKWDDQPASLEGIPGSFARAYRVAMTQPQGPVYVCYDAQLQEDPYDREIALPSPGTMRVPSRLAPDPEALERVAQVLVTAERPVILAEYLGRDAGAVTALVKLAEAVGAPVVDLQARMNFPTRHPLNLTFSAAVREADLVLALDVKDAEPAVTALARPPRRVEPITPPGCRFVEIGFADLNLSKWSTDYGRYREAEISVLADTALAVPLLADRCAEIVKASPARRDEAAARRDDLSARSAALREGWMKEARADWDASPMTTGRLALEIWDAIQHEDWVLTANALGERARRLWDVDQPYRHPGRQLGTATQIGISLGVALAHKGTGRL